MRGVNLSLDKQLEESYYVQIYKEIKYKILTNQIKSGDKLPSIRQLALRLGVNQNTIIQSYNLLEEKGFVKKIPGKGCYVNKNCDLNVDKKELPLMESYRYGHISYDDRINFYNGTPPSRYFPVDDYLEISKKIINNYGGDIFQYQNIQGVESLREVLAEEFEKDDIFVEKDRIQITTGTQQCLDVIIKIFSKNRKPSVAVSNPTYPNALNILNGQCNLITVDLEDDGWDLEEFEKQLKKEKIDFMYEVINYQNPTGISWSIEKRKKILELAEKYDFYIIEDDSFSEFYYFGTKPKSLKSLEKIGKEKVIYIKTFSKILMPGIGIAAMVVPEELLVKSLLVKYGVDTTTSGLNQKILEFIIRDGVLSEHLSMTRALFKQKYDLILKELSEIPELKIIYKPKGGFFIWIELSDKIDSEEFYKKCKAKGVLLLPGIIFSKDGESISKIRLSFVNPSLEDIRLGMNLIKEVISDFYN
nr:PLP-dependent aminotransferase family protein [uncultured Cetobacterium sp.]